LSRKTMKPSLRLRHRPRQSPARIISEHDQQSKQQGQRADFHPTWDPGARRSKRRALRGMPLEAPAAVRRIRVAIVSDPLPLLHVSGLRDTGIPASHRAGCPCC
jgi:hypothetical protein